MFADYLRSLIDYHEWATQRLLGACMEVSGNDYHRDLGLDHHTIHDTLQYQLNMESRWLASYTNDTSKIETQQISGRDSLAAALRGQCRCWRQAVSALQDDELESRIIVESTDGLKCDLSRIELIFQVINYGIQQRGTLSYAIRWLGLPEPQLDFISYRIAP